MNLLHGRDKAVAHQANITNDPFSGGGEMGKLMRLYDWSQTSLGAVENWPQSLKTALTILLNSRYPMFIAWGPELIQFYNDAYRPILGKSKHPSALGQPAQECWPEIWEEIGPEFESVLTTGQPTWHDNEMLLMDRNGYLEECYFIWSYSAIRDETGHINGVFDTVIETTDQVLNERRLRTLRELADLSATTKTPQDASQQVLKGIANHPLDIPFALLYLVDSTGSQANLAGTVGFEPNTPASPAHIALTHPEADPWQLATVLNTGQPAHLQQLTQKFDNLPVHPWQVAPDQAVVFPILQAGESQPAGCLILGISPRRAFDDNYRGFFDLVAGHVTTAISNAHAYEQERQRAESLAELDRAKTLFFSNISHELRTPLTLILNPIEDILGNSNLPADILSQLRLVQRNGVRLLKLVNTLLDFSRIEAGRIQATYQPVDLATLTAEIASGFDSAMVQAGLRFIVNCPSLPAPIYVDPQLWEKIVVNLLSNAWKFTWEGEIIVELLAKDSSVELKIRDTGIGIPPEELPRLFERFRRIEGAQGRTYEGSGIGLSLVQELVQLHGGTIQVESVLTEGSCFTVTLPIGTAHLPSERIQHTSTLMPTTAGIQSYLDEVLPEVAPGASTPQHSTPSARILLVDDNADMRNYIQHLLAPFYTVEAVEDGIAALAAIQRQRPDLVLSDVMMPRLDGVGLLKALRAAPQTQNIPIILVSARVGEEACVEGLEAGADDYLAKPFSTRELLARVRSNLELARLRQEMLQRERTQRLEAEAAQTQIRNILERITDAFVALDQNWQYTYVNPEAAQLLGYDSEFLMGKRLWQDVFVSDIDSPLARRLQEAMAQQVPLHIEDYSPVLNRYLEVNAYPGEEGISIYFRDITERKHIEEQLSASEEFNRRIVESSTDCIKVLDVEGRLLSLNSHGQAIFEIDDLAPLLNHSWINFWQGADRQAAQQAVEQAKAGEKGRFQGYCPTQKGTPKWWDVVVAPIFNAQGQVERLLSLSRDITELKQAEEALRASENLYRTLSEASPDFVWSCDGNARPDFVNSRWVEATGYTLEDIQGQGMEPSVHPGDFPSLMQQWELAIQENEAFEAEFRYRCKDGTYRWCVSRAVPIFDSYGTIIKWIGVTTDIHERKQAEADREQLLQALETERSRFEAVIRQMPAGVLIADATSNQLILVNAQVEHIIGQSYELYHELEEYDRQVQFVGYHADGRCYQPEDWPLFRSLQTGETILGEEIELHRADGSRVTISTNSAPIVDSQGNITAAVVIFQDITDRKQAAMALARSEYQLRLLTDTLPALISYVDREQRYQFVNRVYTDWFGLSPAEIVGKTVAEIVGSDAYQTIQSDIETALSGQKLISEKQVYLQNLGLRYLQRYFIPDINDQGQVQGFYGLVIDVTDLKQAEAALRDSEERFRQMAENIEDVFWVSDKQNYQILYVSPAYERIWGRSCESLYANPYSWIEAIHPDDQERVKAAAFENMGRESFDEEFRIIRPDGSLRWVRDRGFLIREENGQIHRMAGIAEDITERKQAQQTLQRQKEELQLIADAAPALIAYVDSQSCYRFVNRAFTEWFGVPASEILGHTVEAFMGRETYPYMRQDLEAALAGYPVTSELWMPFAQGSSRYVRRQYIPDIRDGVVHGFYAMITDITTLKQTEEALRLSETLAKARAQELETLMEMVPAAIWIAKDPHCHQVSANHMAYQLMRATPDSLATATPADGVNPLKYKQLYKGQEIPLDELPMQLASRTGKEVEAEIEFVFEDGTMTYLYGKAVPLQDEQGQVRGSIGAFVDISERKQAEAEREALLEREKAARNQAEQANRLKDEFLAVLSHELRSPLNPILGWATLLSRRKVDEATLTKALASIERNVRLQVQLVDDLLDVSRILRGKLNLQKKPIHLVSIILAALETVRLAAEAKSIQIQTNFAPIAGQVLGDAGRLQQVVWNLLSNAIKFTPVGGQVEVRLRQFNSQVEIQVQDTGKGISPNFLPFVFEYFRQEDGTTTRRFGGLGLGLAIVRYLTEMHGGIVEASSPGLGQGSTFTVKLPLLSPIATDSEPDHSLQSSEMAAQTLLQDVQILFVEDDTDTREFMRFTLEQAGADVTATASASEALAVLKHASFNLLISDIGMPEMDGYMLMQQIRSQIPFAGSTIKAIALTAYAGEVNRKQALNAGFDEHLAKPVDPAELIAVVTKLMQGD
jgi:PAS domain S-box-containing protein